MLNLKGGLEKELAAWLCSLGRTADEVAEAMRSRKSVGKTNSSYHCPIARAAKRELNPNASVSCGTTRISLDLVVSCEIPFPVEKFIRAFDCGEYPDLIEATPETAQEGTQGPGLVSE